MPTLDGWRAVAVLLVIGAHGTRLLLETGTKVGQVLAGFLSHAGNGVDIFFALSGFLISSLLLREKGSSGSIDIRRFYIRRVFRIIPPMATYLAGR
jgi:peptidoglycan/LPS O-acetylase OafA/YrhL